MNIIGLDPGGANRFGWASLCIGETSSNVALRTGVSSSASGALNDASRVSNAPPLAVGIDAPLFWVTEGERAADIHIRKLVRAAGGHPSKVIHVNSLRGACLVQGVLAARRVSDLWPSALVTETHPGALRCIDPAADAFIASCLPKPPTDHERDAALSAFAAWAAIDHFAGWCDLVTEEKTAPFFPSGQVVSYWFPCKKA